MSHRPLIVPTDIINREPLRDPVFQSPYTQHCYNAEELYHYIYRRGVDPLSKDLWTHAQKEELRLFLKRPAMDPAVAPMHPNAYLIPPGVWMFDGPRAEYFAESFMPRLRQVINIAQVHLDADEQREFVNNWQVVRSRQRDCATKSQHARDIETQYAANLAVLDRLISSPDGLLNRR